MGRDVYAAYAAIGRPSDLAILETLRDGKHASQCQIAEATNLNQSTISRALKELQTRSWVKRTEKGYQLSQPWNDIVTSIQSLVDAYVHELQLVTKHLEALTP